MTRFVAALSEDSIAVEFAGRILADAGLGVVKIEGRDGDGLRRRSAALFAYLAAGKRSVALELPPPAGDGTLASILTAAEVVIADEAGADLACALAGAVPVVAIGTDDLSGVPSRIARDEFLLFHASGLGAITPRMMPGYPSAAPLCPNANLATFMAGHYGAIAALAAIQGRRRNGAAPSARIGATGALLPLLRREIAAVLFEGIVPHRNERIWKVSPAEVHRCRDGWIFVDVIEDGQWLRLTDYMGRPDLGASDMFKTRDLRFANADALCAILDAFFADKPQACWREAQARGVPIAPVNDLDDLRADRQLQARGFWAAIETERGERLAVPRSPAARSRGGADRAPLRVPTIGEHTQSLLTELAA